MSKIAFLFAGQGAQYPGMGKSLYETSPAARRVFDRVQALRPGTLEQCFFGDVQLLAQTENTQPCLFAVDYACAAALQEAGVCADFAAGFSLGEVAAAAFCGILSFDDAFALVCRRGQLMAEAAKAHPGAMTAVLKLDEATVDALAGAYDQVFPVNYNCPGQIVVSGQPDQLAAFEADVAGRGGRTMRLKVSGGFHSPFMAQAAQGLSDYLQSYSFSAPRIALYANATARPYGDPKTLLPLQVKSPVLWQRTIDQMVRDGAAVFVEVGAGKTLCGLMRKMPYDVKCTGVQDAESLKAALAALKGDAPC